MTPQAWLLESKVEPIPGDFICERGNGLIGGAIAFRQGGIWDHVSIPVSTLVKVEMHLVGGYQSNLLNFKKECPYMRLTPEAQQQLDPHKWKERLIFHSLEERKYDIKGIFGSLFGSPKFTKKGSLYCSALLQDVLYYSSGLEITYAQFPWPDRCFEARHIYEPIGFFVKGKVAHLNSLPENRQEIQNLLADFR